MDGLRFGSLFSEWDFPCKEKFTKHSSGTLQKIKNFQSCYISLQRMVLTCLCILRNMPGFFRVLHKHRGLNKLNPKKYISNKETS